MEKIKVFLSDPQVLFREGIHFILSGEEDFEVTGETTSNEEALAHIVANPPNIAILSIADGKLSGPEITRHIKRDLPLVSVIMTIDKDNDEQAFAAMKSGAAAYLTKDTDPELLLDIIRVVTQGSQPIIEILLRPEIAAKILDEFNDLTSLDEQLGHLLAALTSKEVDVLNSIADGNNMEQIADKLETSEEVIRRHLRMILNKVISNEQARAVIEAAQRNLSSVIGNGGGMSHPSNDYVTRIEFNEFKESLMARLKTFIGELA
jgi:DNA-binding NarL/FixJ family response regulator